MMMIDLHQNKTFTYSTACHTSQSHLKPSNIEFISSVSS